MGWVVWLKSGDVVKVFVIELMKVKGLKEDCGNGLSVEILSYFVKLVDIGDEVFCIVLGILLLFGVLVCKGSMLVYVSMIFDEEMFKELVLVGVD